MARVGAIERFVAERKVGDDVALDRRLEQRPLEPGRIPQVAAPDAAVGCEPEPDQDIAAERLGKRDALTACYRHRGPDRALRQPLEDLLEEREALLDLADPDPDPGIDVAVRQDGHVELELVV